MYQRILVPVDGSALSDRAIAASIGLARQLGAAITGFVAEQPRGPRKPAQGAARLRRVEDEDTLTPEDAQGVLERFAAAAHAAGVPFEGHHACVAHADEALRAEAEARGCDLLVHEASGAFPGHSSPADAAAVAAAAGTKRLVLVHLPPLPDGGAAYLAAARPVFAATELGNDGAVYSF